MSRDSSGDISLDIVIVNYNSTGHLLTCLETVLADLPPQVRDEGRGAVKSYGVRKLKLSGVRKLKLSHLSGERIAPRPSPLTPNLHVRIIVQDNGSADGVHRIRAGFPEVHLRRSRKNLGFAKAANAGMQSGDGDYIMLLNPDGRVTPGFFEKALDFMAAHPDVGIMGPKVLDDGGALQNSARSFPTPLTGLFGRTSLLSRHFPNNPITRKNLISGDCDGGNPMPVDWLSGACMVVRREAVRRTGWFDERFFMYWEDADWCRRMWANGWRVVYFPGAAVYHHVGGSSKTRPVRSLFEFHKSVFRYFQKYHDGFGWALVYPMVLSLLGGRFLGKVLRIWFLRYFRRIR